MSEQRTIDFAARIRALDAAAIAKGTREAQERESYSTYLKSPLWVEVIRPRVLERDKHLCCRCPEKATDVHHMSYAREVLDGNCDEMLVSLCGECHRFIHVDRKGRHRLLVEANRVLRESRVLKRDRHLCYRCAGHATEVHRISTAPEVLEGKRDEMLVSLCDGCFGFIHFDDNGNRRVLSAANRLLRDNEAAVSVPPAKYDLRRKYPNQYPPQWRRMNAPQRETWEREFKRQGDLKIRKKFKDNPRMLALSTEPDTRC